MSRPFSRHAFTAHWSPLGVERETSGRPPVGRLIAYRHAVWRVVKVTDRKLPADAEKWDKPPYGVDLDWVAGAEPPWRDKHPDKVGGTLEIPFRRYVSWLVYPVSDRWPMCSCCGEPVPCRAEMQDRAIDAGMERVADLMSILPGTCWACREPITHRQDSVTYPGENFLLPGAPPPSFHTRQACVGSAKKYEEDWIYGGPPPPAPKRKDLPACHGHLIVHADGTSECHGGRDDCWGHTTGTHDQREVRACYEQTHGCGRDCPTEGHPGPNPGGAPRRVQVRGRVLTYPTCHGQLVVHADGTSECRHGVPGCGGYPTHDHGSWSTCYYADEGYECPKGCPPRGHGTSAVARRPRRNPWPGPTLLDTPDDPERGAPS